jgi:NDP-sugar pyrophosphorylase family protein
MKTIIDKTILYISRDKHTYLEHLGLPSLALLTVSNKPVIYYTLENLKEYGLLDIELYSDDEQIQDHTKQLVGTGERWGLRIQYKLVDELINHQMEHENVLILRGNVLRRLNLEEFIKIAGNIDESIIEAHNGRQSLETAYLKKGSSLASWLKYNSHEFKAILTDAYINRLKSANDYLTAHMDYAKGLLPKHYMEDAISDSIIIHSKTNLLANSFKTSSSYIGENVEVHKSVKIYDKSYILACAHIDSGTTVRNSLILENTYVGKNLNIHDAIVCNDKLINIITESAINIDDRSILSGH